jgi:hypothetical protein
MSASCIFMVWCLIKHRDNFTSTEVADLCVMSAGVSMQPWSSWGTTAKSWVGCRRSLAVSITVSWMRGKQPCRPERQNLEACGTTAPHNIVQLNIHLQWNLYLSFPDNSFSRIRRSISMFPERILFQLWLPHLLFSRVHCFFFRPPTKTMNRGFTVFNLWRNNYSLISFRMQGLYWGHGKKSNGSTPSASSLCCYSSFSSRVAIHFTQMLEVITVASDKRLGLFDEGRKELMGAVSFPRMQWSSRSLCNMSTLV